MLHEAQSKQPCPASASTRQHTKAKIAWCLDHNLLTCCMLHEAQSSSLAQLQHPLANIITVQTRSKDCCS
jgi:hypothetical protein